MVVLCERSQLQDLVEFPYVNLHNEVIGLRWEEGGAQPLSLKELSTHLSLRVLQVVGIIESHARAVDLMTHNYYELLYAFHIYRHNYRKGKAWRGHVVTAGRHRFPCPCGVACPGSRLMSSSSLLSWNSDV